MRVVQVMSNTDWSAMKPLIVVIAAFALIAAATDASAATTDLTACFASTSASTTNSKDILANLGLTQTR